MKFTKKMLVFGSLISVTGYSVATEADSMTAKVLESKDIELIKKVNRLRRLLIAKLRDEDKVWITSPIPSAIKLWSDNKSLITESIFKKVEALLKKGANKDAMEEFDDFIVAITSTARTN